MKTCALCGEKKKPEDFRYIPYFLAEDPERKKTWCRVCQAVWIKKKKELRDLMPKQHVMIESRAVSVDFS
jgi:hypothetical protein